MANASLAWIVEGKKDLAAFFPAFYWRSLRGSALVCFVFLLMAANTPAQDTKTRKTTKGSAFSVTNYQDLPVADSSCNSEECAWWNRLREAGNKILRKGDQNSKKAYASLFVEGMEKSYRVPLADRPPYVLVFGPPLRPSDLPSKQKNGTVSLLVEQRADGTVGEVKVLSGVSPDLDQRCIEAARSVIFWPAVKDGKFVTQWQPAEYKFQKG